MSTVSTIYRITTKSGVVEILADSFSEAWALARDMYGATRRAQVRPAETPTRDGDRP